MIKEHSGMNLLRVVAAFLVVFIHVSPEGFGVKSESWLGINVMASISRVSVPLFFMASGYFALRCDNEINLKNFFFKKSSRLFFPLALWSLVYIVYDKTIINTSTIWGFLTTTPAHYHLWFFYTLIPMVLISPLLSKMVRGVNATYVVYFTILWLLLSLIPSLVQALIYFLNEEDPILKVGKAQLFIAMLGYFLLGGFLREVKFRISSKLLVVIFTLSTAITIFSTCIISNTIGAPSQGFFVYYSPFIASSTIALFIIFERLNIDNDRVSKTISTISKYTLGIYLIHPIIIDHLKLSILKSTTATSLLLMTVVIFITSMIATFLISKIPFVRKSVL